MGPVPLPISIEDLCIYIQFLSEELAAPQSVSNYINGLRVLHTLTDLPTTSFYLADVKLMMLGVRRLKQHRVRQAEPITLDMLLKMSSRVDSGDISQVACWTAILTAFFCMLRSSNLIPKSRAAFDQDKQLCRSDILEGHSCWAVKIRWSKTIQFANREFYLPLVPIPNSPLCPVKALRYYLQKSAGSGLRGAFSVKSRGKWFPLTYSKLLKQFKKWVAEIGYSSKSFALHSLRRGAATLAFESKLPAELIKAQGDWASDAYLRYLSISTAQRCRVAEALRGEVVAAELLSPP